MGADGGHSTVRKLTGMSTYGWEYGQEAIVATVKCSRTGGDDDDANSSSHHSNGKGSASRQVTAWQKYLPTGRLINNYRFVIKCSSKLLLLLQLLYSNCFSTL